jgi:hypothetical protein
LETTLPSGSYVDEVYGQTFTVKNGFLEGRVAPLTSYILRSE